MVSCVKQENRRPGQQSSIEANIFRHNNLFLWMRHNYENLTIHFLELGMRVGTVDLTSWLIFSENVVIPYCNNPIVIPVSNCMYCHPITILNLYLFLCLVNLFILFLFLLDFFLLLQFFLLDLLPII